MLPHQLLSSPDVIFLVVSSHVVAYPVAASPNPLLPGQLLPGQLLPPQLLPPLFLPPQLLPPLLLPPRWCHCPASNPVVASLNFFQALLITCWYSSCMDRHCLTLREKVKGNIPKEIKRNYRSQELPAKLLLPAEATIEAVAHRSYQGSYRSQKLPEKPSLPDKLLLEQATREAIAPSGYQRSFRS